MEPSGRAAVSLDLGRARTGTALVPMRTTGTSIASDAMNSGSRGCSDRNLRECELDLGVASSQPLGRSFLSDSDRAISISWRMDAAYNYVQCGMCVWGWAQDEQAPHACRYESGLVW